LLAWKGEKMIFFKLSSIASGMSDLIKVGG